MDNTIVETEKSVETKAETIETETEQVTEIEEQESPVSNGRTAYLNSLENITVADYKRQEENKRIREFQKEKEELIQKQYETAPQEEKKEEVQTIIEKPNFDLLQSKTIKISKKQQTQKKQPKKKKLSLILSIVFGICGVICIGNIIAIDQISNNLAAIEHELYEVNLPRYLENIAKLDTAKKGMDFVETYPEDKQNAGEVGQKTNWFNKLCDFLSGVFGG